MTAVLPWGELEVSFGIAREWPSGEWDYSVWDESVWEETDTPLGDWLDVTCDCQVPIGLGAGSDRGDGVVNRWEAATAQLSFGNGHYNYDPRTGPWAGLVGPGLPVRIQWRPLDGSAWRPVFIGLVQNGGYEWDPAAETATLHCTDRTALLVGVDLPSLEPPRGAGDWASARLHWLADQAEWTPLQRDIASGGVSLIASHVDGPVWEQMLDIADSDLGLVWVRRDGRIAYRPQGRVAENRPINAVLEACPDEETVSTFPNLLTIDQATFEASITGWASSLGSAVSLARSTASAAEGTASLAVTALAAPTTPIEAQTEPGIPAQPGDVITGMASVRVPGLALMSRITTGFEAGLNAYTTASANLVAAVDTAMKRTGTQSLRVVRANSSGAMQLFSNTQTTTGKDPVTPGHVVTLTAWVRHNRAAGTVVIPLTARFNLGNAGLQEIVGPTTSVPANTWVKLSVTATVPANVDSVTLALTTPGYSWAIGESCWFDDMSGVDETARGTEVAAALAFYNAAGSPIGSPTVIAADTPPPGQWFALSGNAIAPPGAARCRLSISTATATPQVEGQAVGIDRTGLFYGMPPTWEPPATTPVPNRLPSDAAASFESGTYAPWLVSNGALAVTTDAADDGTRALGMTATHAGAYAQAGGRPDAMAVTPGTTVSLMASVRPAQAGRTCYLGVVWWDAAGAASFQWGALASLGAANTWVRLLHYVVAPATAVAATLIVSPRGMATDGSERTLVDRCGIFPSGVGVGQWQLPSAVPPTPDPEDATRVGYVDLLHVAPEVLRNWVTIAGAKPAVAEGAPEPADRPITIRVDGPSVSRFGKVTYSAVDLLHDQDAWSPIVAEAVLAVGAWPTTAPTSVALDTRTHNQPEEIAAVLLDVEPEDVFSVVSPVDRVTTWRVIPAGWDVEIRDDRVEGTLALEDVTGWADAAGWDDEAPHGWDTEDVWALSGWIGGGGGTGPVGPTVSTFELAAETDIPTVAIPIQVPLIDPGTGHATYAPVLGPGTYRIDVLTTFGAGWNDTVRASVSVGGTQWATGTATPTETAPAAVTLVAASVAVSASAPLELTVQTTATPGRVIAPTRVVVTRLT